MVLVLMMSPLVVFADPEGFCEIEITKDNFFEYFGYRKAKKQKLLANMMDMNINYIVN